MNDIKRFLTTRRLINPLQENDPITYGLEYKGLPINTLPGLGCYTVMLDKIHDLMITFTTNYSKTLFIRFDLRFPDGYPVTNDNSILTKFINSFTQQYRRDNITYGYFWCRESAPNNSHQHYHFILLLNGHKVQEYHGHLLRLDEVWNNTLGVCQQGLVNFCNKNKKGVPQENGIMLNRNDPSSPAEFARCFEWASYLTKTRSKEGTPAYGNNWGCSQIKPAQQHVHQPLQRCI